MAAARAMVVAVALLVGCSGGILPTRWTETTAPWRLEAEPDGPVLLVRAEFGGSSCTRFVGWEVDESDAAVEIAAIVERSDARECTADLVLERAQLTLDAPLGDRVLRGCEPTGGVGDCRRVVPSP